jgi:hypothetical protein
MYKGDKTALEDIDNCSICVVTESGIRKMKFDDDIVSNLVYVNNVSLTYDGKSFVIKKGEYIRYIPIAIVEKMNRLY